MLSDEELLRQIAAGNAAGMETLVYRYHKAIYVYLLRMTGNSYVAEDLTQECFLRLYNAVLGGKYPASCRPWIYRIATNLCKDRWKSAGFRNEAAWEEDGIARTSDEEAPVSLLERQWERERVIQALSEIPDDEREIVILRFYQELKLDEIAETVEIPLSTVKTKLYRAFKRLAALLKEEDGYERAEKR
ncbi:RNA polymerase sigma factor [Paenibacillaceae bacterium]|nr:RNA polymerase sigma factor [Paenibacillaceae bacterium]